MSPSNIKSFEKFAEGGHNRIFTITMDDSSTLLARLPYPSTLPRRLAVASEVATLDLLRSHEIPTPRVLAYSTGEDAVGVEYMLMERLPGKPLSGIWFSLAEEERCKILHQIVAMETKLFAIKLPANGSIYYSRDLPPECPRIDLPGCNSGLCMGPYTSTRWWHRERGDLDIDRGPRKSFPFLFRD